MAAAAAALNAGDARHARLMLHDLAGAHPDQADLQHLYGLACWRSGDAEAAERAIRAAISCDRRRPAFLYDFGRVQLSLGREKEAERSLRAVLALDRRHAGAVATLAEFLNLRGRAAEALQCTTPLVALTSADEAVLCAHAEALRQLGRHAERLTVCLRTARDYPRSAVAAHNIAAAEADLGHAAEAEAAARNALAMGSDAPETWLVLGRVLLAQSRLDEAERALDAALSRRPRMVEAHREVAQLIWMRSGEREPALSRLDQAIGREPGDLALHLLKVQLLDSVGDEDGARAALAAASARSGASVALETAAARLFLRHDPRQALEHARKATVLDSHDTAAQMALCEALLANGEAREADAAISGLRRARPHDQHLLAYQATVWRLLGDARYGQLYDYPAFVKSFRVEASDSAAGSAAFLTELKAALLGLHGLAAHPFDQSLRGGSQTPQRLDTVRDPAIRAVFDAIDAPVRRYISDLGRGKDPLRVRNQGGYALGGAWSVRLTPGQGRHVDHVHQHGWISSAFYVELPAAVDAGGQEGWIKFGEPGVPTRPALGPEHAVKPEVGTLVLFPSYMWHGTLPFRGDQTRLTMAFDFVPAASPRLAAQASG